MKIATVLFATIFASLAIGLAVWLVKAAPPPAIPSVPGPVVRTGLEIPPTGPYPKAVVSEREFIFGTMEVGEERTHVFKIKNEGKALLKLKKGETTCQCTLSDLARKEIPVGETAEVTLTWKPTGITESFHKGAEIHTNDPEAQTIKLSLSGKVFGRVGIHPVDNWRMLEVNEKEPSTFTGYIYSPTLADFKVVEVSTGSKEITAKVEPFTKDSPYLDRSKCGYTITVTVPAESKAGPFSYPIVVKTNVPERNADGTLATKLIEQKVTLSGSRKGPMRMFGSDYDEETSAVKMGQFDASEGGSKKYILLANDCPPDMKLIKTDVDPQELKVSLTPLKGQTNQGGTQKFELIFEYPKGSKRMIRTGDEPAKVRLTTNHPNLKEIYFEVFFNAY